MKTACKALVGGILMLVSGVAAADFSANAALTSDYRFRGVSQSAQDPAVQGGVDFSDKSGVYLGAWGSTIDFGSGLDADLEVDLYGGYKWNAAGIDWDVGLIHYAYPGSESSADLPFTEIYFGGTYGPVFAKYYYTSDYTGTTEEGAYYLTAGANLDLGSGFTLVLSLGQSGGDGIDATFGDSYTDYKVGVSKDLAGLTFNLSYIDTSGAPEITTDVFNNEDTVVLTVSKTF